MIIEDCEEWYQKRVTAGRDCPGRRISPLSLLAASLLSLFILSLDSASCASDGRWSEIKAAPTGDVGLEELKPTVVIRSKKTIPAPPQAWSGVSGSVSDGFKASQSVLPDQAPKVRPDLSQPRARKLTDVLTAAEKAAAKRKARVDPPVSYLGGSSVRWSKENMPLKVFIAPGDALFGYKPAFRKSVETSLDEWCQASGGKLSYKLVDDQQAADITVGWTLDQLQPSKNGEQVPGITDLDCGVEQGKIEPDRASILIRTVDCSRTSCGVSDGECAAAIKHEVGHALGIPHSPHRGDIMYRSLDPRVVSHDVDITAIRLSANDKATIKQLYQGYPALAVSGRLGRDVANHFTDKRAAAISAQHRAIVRTGPTHATVRQTTD